MDVRWLKKNNGRCYQHLHYRYWKLTVKDLMGRMLTYRGCIYKDLEYISIPGQYLVLEGCVLLFWTWHRISRALWMAGRLPASLPCERAFPCFSLLAVLPFPLLPEQPDLRSCASVSPVLRYWMDTGWVLTWGAEELQWGARWFQFLMCMFQLISC